MEEQSKSGDSVYATCEIYYLSGDNISHERVFIFSLQDNPYATLTMSLAETSFCRKYGFDPQSPLCAHTILSGTVIKVNSYPTRTDNGFRKHCLVSSEGRDILRVK